MMGLISTILCSLKLKKLVNCLKILWPVTTMQRQGFYQKIITFKSSWCSTKCLFSPIKKVVAIIYILLLLIHSQRLYKLVKVIINTPIFAKIILNIVICHHDFSGSVIADSNSFFLLWNLRLLCYFLYIRRYLSIAFYLQNQRSYQKVE